MDQDEPTGFGMWPDLRYFSTIHGIPKILQIIFGILCIICATTWKYSTTGTLLIICCVALITTLVWTFIYGCRVYYVLHCLSWITLELLSNCFVLLLYTSATAVQSIVVLGLGQRPRIESITIFILVLCILNTLLYGIGCFLSFQLWRALRDHEDENNVALHDTDMS